MKLANKVVNTILEPLSFVLRFPPGVSCEEGALIEPAGLPFHALIRRAKLTPGETVAVYSAGGIGVFAICVAKLLT